MMLKIILSAKMESQKSFFALSFATSLVAIVDKPKSENTASKVAKDKAKVNLPYS